MKTFSKAMLAGLMIAVSVLPGLQAKAQSDPEPAIVICMAPLKEQMKDIGYIAEAAGFGQMSFLIKMQMEQFLKGIDTENPSGVLMYLGEDQKDPRAIGFLPISDMEQFLEIVDQYAKVEEGADLTTIIPDSGPELLMKEVNGYAYFSDREEMFEFLPNDPVGLAGDLPENYNIGAKVFAQRIPASLRESWLDEIEDSYAKSIEEMGGLPSDVQEQNFEMQMKTIRSLINETEEMVIGLAANSTTESMYIDLQMTGLEGSKIANESATQEGIEASKFSSLLMDEATFTANICVEISEEDAKQQLAMLGSLRDELADELNDSDMTDKELEMAESIADDMFEVFKDTVEEGRMDVAMVVNTGEDQTDFAIGFQVSDARKLEDAVKDLARMAENEPGFGEVVEFNLNSGTLEGLQLHEVVVQLASSPPEVTDYLGDELTLLLAVGKKEIYIVGSSDDPMVLLKEAVNPNNANENEQVMMQYNLFLGPLLEMSSAIEGDEMTEKMSDLLAETGKDRIRLDAQWIKNGFKGRFDIQDGVLGLIGVSMENFGLMGGAEF